LQVCVRDPHFCVWIDPGEHREACLRHGQQPAEITGRIAAAARGVWHGNAATHLKFGDDRHARSIATDAVVAATSVRTRCTTTAAVYGQGVKVFPLYHVALLGCYPTAERAQNRIERARSLPGSGDEPDCFMASKYKLDRDEWPRGFISVP
jgi:hypothetical protein